MVTVCVDASLVVKWLLPEEGSQEALSLYEDWKKKGVALIAPSLIDYEVANAIRQKVRRGLLRPERLYSVIDFYGRTGLLLFHLTGLVDQAVSLSASLDQATVYDVAYLLTAKQQGADFVTADEAFCRQVQPLYSFVQYFRDLA